jgi:hypothetical protein
MDDFQSTFLPAFFGSGLQELLYWYDLRTKLDQGKYAVMLRSPSYWIVTMLIVLGSAYGTTIWFAGQNASPKDFMIVSAAFPLLFKHAVSASGRRRVLGSNVVRSYFRME